MRIGPAIHGALLVLALVFAYKTWTRDKTEKPKTGDVVVWSESPESFESLTFTAKNKEVLVTKRSDAAGPYLWGRVTRTRNKVQSTSNPHGAPGGHGPGHGHGHGAPPAPKPTPKDGAKPDPAKPGAAKPGAAKPGAAKPGAKPPAKQPPATKKPAAKPAAPSDGKKANQNDPIPKKAAPPAKPGANPKAAPAKPKAAPGKPKATPGTPKAKATPGAIPAAGAPGADTKPAVPLKAPAPKPPAEKETTIRQFPVGDTGDDLLANFTQLRALRTLGTPSEEEKLDFGLDESEERIVVKFAGGKERTLLVGDRVFGGSNRYVLDESTGTGYVLAASIMKHLDSAETTLGLKKYNDFDLKDDLFEIKVNAGGPTETLVRLELSDPKSEKPKSRTTWALKASATIEDVRMANFVDRASKLRPVEYSPDLKPESLKLLARFEYGDRGGKSIGYLDFYKGKDPASAKDGAPAKEEYFMRTERTRVVGKVSKLTAERVEQDLAEIFAKTPEDATQPPPGPTGPVPGAPVPGGKE